jgi:predicted MFS family arabinose efflux permease
LSSYHAGGPREAGFVIAGLGLGGIVFSMLVSPTVRLLGTYGMMRWGGVMAALGLCGLMLQVTWPLWASAFSLIGFGFFMLHNSLQTKATELAPTARGSAIALHAFFFFLGQAIGPVIFGLELSFLEVTMTLAVQAMTIAAVGFVSAYLLKRADQQQGLRSQTI